MRAALFLALAALSVPVAGGARSAVRASLRVVRTQPLVVEGRRFKPLERVRLTLATRSLTLQRTAGATRSGSFDVGFGVRLGPCLGFTLRAIGSRGSGALLKRPPLPACTPE